MTHDVTSSSCGQQADQAQLRVPLSLANLKCWIQGLLEQPSGFAENAYPIDGALANDKKTDACFLPAQRF